MTLRHALAQHEAVRERSTFAQTAVVDDDREVIVRMNVNIEEDRFISDDPSRIDTVLYLLGIMSSYNIVECRGSVFTLKILYKAWIWLCGHNSCCTMTYM